MPRRNTTDETKAAAKARARTIKAPGAKTTKASGGGPAQALLTARRVFSTEGVSPYDQVEWSHRDIVQTDWRTGAEVFAQRGVEFPAGWSDNAATIVTTKYFRGAQGTPAREQSLRQVIERVVSVYAKAAAEHNYFASKADVDVFADELRWMLLNQVFSFNSPVWFNVGTAAPQTVSACFILHVEDSLKSILNWYSEEGTIFQAGSGAGVNLSAIRSSKELLSSGGTASGPVSFMRGADASAGTIKSGGATRRAAKMVVLDVDHPDIVEFIDTKAHEEGKIRALRDAGYDMEFGGHDSTSVQYQNANNSVRVSDEFMSAVEAGTGFALRARGDGSVMETVDARELFTRMCQAAWECADPGIQYDDTINRWHTLANTGRITASNPCFTGDTLVAVADGRNAVRIDELAAEGSTVDVYSRTASGATVIRPMSGIRLTRRDAELVRVTLDDGTAVRCTPDHLFMLRDGSYRAASELREGDSLARFDSDTFHVGGPAGSVRRRVSSARGWLLQYRAIGEHRYGNYRDGRGGFHLDHVDGDSLNDAPSNLQVLTAEEHTAKTTSENMLGESNPARRMMNDQWRENISKAMSGERNPRWMDVSDEELAAVYFAAVTQDPKAGLRKGYVAWNTYLRANNLVGQVPLATGVGRIRGKSWDEFAEQMRQLAPAVNHKVVSVLPAGRADVYDGEVAETHNFAIITTVDADPRDGSLSGVFVHNCSEYLSVDNSSCNLASLNLLKFRRPDGTFNIDLFIAAVETVTTAMDISICFADFPTDAIGDNTRAYRQLGIGYANLGALLMADGLPYDSDAGRDYAAAITSLMTATAYRRSAEMARAVGAYTGYAANTAPHQAVMALHSDAGAALADTAGHGADVARAAHTQWQSGLGIGRKHGWRNAQASVLAPTGTIGFMMDCDTTGIEPDFSLVKFKKLVGGSSMQIVNRAIPEALRTLGYTQADADAVVAHVLEHNSVVDAPALRPEHHAVFDTATGDRPISAMGHVRMMAAVQPFLSGAISKTVNMPEDATLADVESIYFAGWKMGLKALAIYRDNCKVGQPLSATAATADDAPTDEEVPVVPVRRQLPGTRRSRTYKFSVSGVSGYLTTGEYDDGNLGELFVRVSKQGSTLSGIMDGLAMSVSVGLQYGVPLETFVAKYVGSSFEPAGMTVDPDVRMTTSLLDWMFRRLAMDYLPADVRQAYGIYTMAERVAAVDSPHAAEAPLAVEAAPVKHREVEKPMCMTCGTSAYMERTGACYACRQCGGSLGCS